MGTLESCYKVLKTLERRKELNPSKLKMDPKDYATALKTLIDENYVAGASVQENIIGGLEIYVDEARITLSGAE